MAIGKLGARGGFGRSGAVLGTVVASAGMPPAPPGYHWDFVTYNGQQVTSNGVNVVALVSN